MHRSILIVIAAALLAPAVVARQESKGDAETAAPARSEEALIVLEKSLVPLVERFNADSERRRLVALLSPT